MSDALAATAAYGPLDRLLHRLAFVHPGLQRVLADIENDVFEKRLAGVRVERPVFVAGLPRAGTTLVLELLYGTGEFASFTYRQMPFVLNPLLWDRISSRSQRSSVARERAHGDAMMIGLDSPEAFEEVLWINHLADVLFDGDTMRTLGPEDLTDEFRTAFRRLAQKIVCLSDDRAKSAGRAPPDPSSAPVERSANAPRYLSKNNANIARLPAIASVFGDATLLCCFRHPAAHVASLHAQHQRFLDMHDDDAFAARYMAWIGHHDFGRNFRPIRFDGRTAGGASGADASIIAASSGEGASTAEGSGTGGSAVDGTRDPTMEASPTEPAFWLRYWIDAYRHALEHAPPQTRFVRFEALLEDGESALGRLAEAVGLARPEALIGAASTLRAPTSAPASFEAVPSGLVDEAEALYRELGERAV